MKLFLEFCVLFFVIASCSGDINDYFTPTRTQTGEGTYYNYVANGACTLDPLPQGISTITDNVAMNAPQWNNSLVCGMCIEVLGQNNPIGGPRIVFVNDLCPECANGDLDFGDSGNGRWSITWRAVDCPYPVNTPISFMFQGSNDWYIKIQVRRHIIPVKSVEIQPGQTGPFTALERTSDNFFLAPLGFSFPLIYPINVRVIAIDGQVITGIVQSSTQLNTPNVEYPQTSNFGPFQGNPTTAPVTTAPVTTAPVTTAPVTTAPVTSAPITTVPMTSAPMTTVPMTSAPVTTVPMTSAPVTTVPMTSAPVTTVPMTSAPMTTVPMTSAPVTSAHITNVPVTSPTIFVPPSFVQTTFAVPTFVNSNMPPSGSIFIPTPFIPIVVPNEDCLSGFYISYQTEPISENTCKVNVKVQTLRSSFVYAKIDVYTQAKIKKNNKRKYKVRDISVFDKLSNGYDLRIRSKDAITKDSSYSFSITTNSCSSTYFFCVKRIQNYN